MWICAQPGKDVKYSSKEQTLFLVPGFPLVVGGGGGGGLTVFCLGKHNLEDLVISYM